MKREELDEFVGALKKRLAETKDRWCPHFDMLGDTEGGFYSSDEMDFDALLREIDEFSRTFG